MESWGVGHDPEFNAFRDPQLHPLWRSGVYMSVDAPSPLVAEIMMGDGWVNCRSSCMVVVTTAGRIIYQTRREGRQGFGGGKHSMPLLLKCHSCRRELFFESNIDVANKAIVRISSPVLVTQATTSSAYPTSCWVQVMVLDNALVRGEQDGRVFVGGVQLFSREVARSAGYPELTSVVTYEHLEAGTWWCGSQIFGICALNDAIDDAYSWRPCDHNTLNLLHGFINEARSSCVLARAIAISDAEVPTDYHKLCEETMEGWSSHMGDIATKPWPLLSTTMLYNYWCYPAWRRETLLRFRDAFGEMTRRFLHVL